MTDPTTPAVPSPPPSGIFVADGLVGEPVPGGTLYRNARLVLGGPRGEIASDVGDVLIPAFPDLGPLSGEEIDALIRGYIEGANRGEPA